MIDLNLLASRLIQLDSKPTASASAARPSAIFGSGASLGDALTLQQPVRIGMWPAIYAEAPETALGLTTVLAYMLEHWRDIRVYRLFAQLDVTAQPFVWDISRSQFEVDDWTLDALDDNVGVWAALTQQGGTWLLQVSLENDLSADDDADAVETFGISGTDLYSLTMALPSLARSIAVALLDPSAGRRVALDFQHTPLSDAAMSTLLHAAFRWELALLLHLAEVPDYDLAALKTAFETLTQAAQNAAELGAWLVARAWNRAALPGLGELASRLDQPEALSQRFASYGLANAVLARALYQQGASKRAVDLLEARLSQHSAQPAAWLALADLYIRAGQVLKAVDAFQRAIEDDQANAAIYTSYGQVLPLVEAQGWVIEEFVLIDPDEYGDDAVIAEAAAAFAAAAQHTAVDPAYVLAQQCLLLIELEDDEQLWSAFKRLLEVDETGDEVRSVVDEFYNLDDAHPGMTLLRHAALQVPEQPERLVNLAAAYVAMDEPNEALQVLTKAEMLIDDPYLHNEISRLTLLAEDPEFDMRIGEISDSIENETTVDARDLTYLENALKRAPGMIDVYLLLAQAYLQRQDQTGALETLLDALEAAPKDPDVLEMLAQLLWDAEDYDTAYSYISRAVRVDPTHIPSLSTSGRFLFEDGQREAARAMLSQAEALAPNHPALRKVKVYIARLLSEEEQDD